MQLLEAAIQRLQQSGILLSAKASVRSLSGGVSSEILLIEDGKRRLVVKQALAKLRVKDEWFADVERNRFEQAYLRFASGVVPDCVPPIVCSDEEHHFFVMEYLGDGWRNWKSELLAGRLDAPYARTVGNVLAAVHQASWTNATVRHDFPTTANFYKLRLEPYLVTTGKRHPPLQAYFDAESARLEHCSEALVHGDFSPKNILVDARSARIAVLDCEVAWFGDPVFDVAFLLNHFLLKSLHRPELRQGYIGLAMAFLEAYTSRLSALWTPGHEARLTRLLLLLLLARVDGKSPVEYLVNQPRPQRLVREFVSAQLSCCPETFADLVEDWLRVLEDGNAHRTS